MTEEGVIVGLSPQSLYQVGHRVRTRSQTTSRSDGPTLICSAIEFVVEDVIAAGCFLKDVTRIVSTTGIAWVQRIRNT